MSTKQAETYATINIADLPLIDFAQIGETDENTIRKSLDGLQFVIKWNTEPTFILDGSVAIIQVMTHAEALVLMASAAWSKPIDEGFVNKPAKIKI
tara:strand:+ start:1371 stop:1658 length:288 start_codon:yes stop_codon:yes gene_type:complete